MSVRRTSQDVLIIAIIPLVALTVPVTMGISLEKIHCLAMVS